MPSRYSDVFHWRSKSTHIWWTKSFRRSVKTITLCHAHVSQFHITSTILQISRVYTGAIFRDTSVLSRKRNSFGKSGAICERPMPFLIFISQSDADVISTMFTQVNQSNTRIFPILNLNLNQAFYSKTKIPVYLLTTY